MSRNIWTILCLAYIVGLLSTGLFNWSNSDWQNLAIVAIGLAGLSIFISILVTRFPYVRKYSKVCLSAGIIAIFALVYFQLRIPQPKVNDISYLLTESPSQFITVEGKVLTEPRLTESERIKFWFQPRQVEASPPKKVAGKLYVTLPLSPDINIYPGKNVSIKGILYRPQTVPVITKKLDWLPPTIATVIAVPLAASIWTLPLICYVFNTVATYSILVNIIATPLVTIISLGGMISSIIAVIIPPLGSAIASFLFYPSLLLIEITKFFTSLPGSTFAVGKISLSSLLLIYLLLCLVWLSKWWQVRWYFVLLFTLTLIILPIIYNHFNLVQITVLAAKQEQVIVVRDKGKVILINSGQADTAKYTVLPFLKEQGINYLDYGIALDNSSSFSQGWSQIATSIAIENLVINPAIEPPIKINSPKIKLLPDNTDLTLNSIKINIINDRPPLLKLDVKDSIWLILGKLKETKQIDIKKYLQKNNFSFSPQVFLYSGTKIEPTWLKILQPKIAIASTSRIKEDSQKLLQEKRIKSYITGENGAIIWQPKTNFKTIIDNN